MLRNNKKGIKVFMLKWFMRDKKHIFTKNIIEKRAYLRLFQGNIVNNICSGFLFVDKKIRGISDVIKFPQSSFNFTLNKKYI